MIDKLLGFTLDLNRLDANTKAKVIQILNKAQRELIADLASNNLTTFGKLRRQTLLKDAKSIIESYYESAQLKLFDTLGPISDVTIKQTAKALESKLPASMDASLPPKGMFESMVNDSIILGTTINDWWSKQATDVVFRYSAAVKQGLTLGETNQQIINRVKQVMDVARRNAASLVQTSVANVANASRQATFEANKDVIKGYKWISTLDSRICELCIARSDKEWTVDGKPINHGIPFQVPGVHFNDRCILTAITKTFAELGFPDIKEPKQGQRASEDGPVSDKTTFEDFLTRKGEAWQNDVLGKGRAELWRAGKIDLENLIDGSGRQLTVNELIRKYS